MELREAIKQVYRDAKGDDNERPYAVFRILSKNLDWHDDDKNEFIGMFWETTNFPSHHAEIWKKIFKHYPLVNEYKSLHIRLEPLDVYRGASQNGFSWTTDLKKAVWFCNRNREMGDSSSVVFGATVRPHGIYFETDNRNEKEVLIRYWRKDIWKQAPIDVTDFIPK